MTHPLVSIITPMHNASKTIEETLKSVGGQSYQNWEHLVIDNKSTDDGVKKVQAWAQTDSRITLLSFYDEPSAGLTRNVGIQAARGRYIAFLDADDTWMPEKLEEQIRFMQENELAFSWTSYEVDTGKPGSLPIRTATQYASSKDLLAKRAVIGCLTTIYDTQKLGKVFMTDIKKRQDFVLFVTILRLVEEKDLKAQGMKEILARYRLQENSLSSDKSSAAAYQWKALTQYCGLNKIQAAWCFSSYAIHGILDRLIMRQKR